MAGLNTKTGARNVDYTPKVKAQEAKLFTGGSSGSTYREQNLKATDPYSGTTAGGNQFQLPSSQMQGSGISPSSPSYSWGNSISQQQTDFYKAMMADANAIRQDNMAYGDRTRESNNASAQTIARTQANAQLGSAGVQADAQIRTTTLNKANDLGSGDMVSDWYATKALGLNPLGGTYDLARTRQLQDFENDSKANTARMYDTFDSNHQQNLDQIARSVQDQKDAYAQGNENAYRNAQLQMENQRLQQAAHESSRQAELKQNELITQAQIEAQKNQTARYQADAGVKGQLLSGMFGALGGAGQGQYARYW